VTGEFLDSTPTSASQLFTVTFGYIGLHIGLNWCGLCAGQV